MIQHVFERYGREHVAMIGAVHTFQGRSAVADIAKVYGIGEREVRRFHALPVDEKMAIRVNEHQRGFIPSKATIVKHSTYEKHTKLDTVECLVLATDYPDGHPESVAGKQFYGCSRFPSCRYTRET